MYVRVHTANWRASCAPACGLSFAPSPHHRAPLARILRAKARANLESCALCFWRGYLPKGVFCAPVCWIGRVPTFAYLHGVKPRGATQRAFFLGDFFLYTS